ncbi:MAG: hypothetical protein ACOYXM_02180 [Actinomycetota bacterium]
MQGTVAAFDDDRGLGEVRSGDDLYPFHCTAILDGTRTIDVGTKVTFGLRAAGLGRWEATAIEKVA